MIEFFQISYQTLISSTNCEYGDDDFKAGYEVFYRRVYLTTSMLPTESLSAFKYYLFIVIYASGVI